MRSHGRDERIKDYFYGSRTKYHPHNFDVPFVHVPIYEIGAPALPDSCMPADMKVDDHMTKLVPVEISKCFYNNTSLGVTKNRNQCLLLSLTLL